MASDKNLLYGETEPVADDQANSSAAEPLAAPSREEILQGLEDRVDALDSEIKALQAKITPLEIERDDALFAIRALKGEATAPGKRKRATAAEVAERRNRIEEVYKDNPDTDPQVLADEFKVSLSTINADKSFLIQAGRLEPGKRGPKPR